MEKYIGKKLDGRYEIQDIIGMGGMSVVYKAYDSIEDRTVAIKILKEEYLSSEEFRRRFKNESKAVAVLSHPNIVRVFDVSFGDRIQYIVMEYIDGITLKEYIDQQKVLTWKEAVHFTTQILRALQHAHERGIVHRDIKPQNIMLLADGTIKVTDFGIARFAHSETKTMTDRAIGSVHYISPEQARGGDTDEKTDIYSVGVMLYEMLTGRLPFEADSAVSVAIMQMQADPKHPREINDGIPEGLEDITLRAMQKDPEQRYQSASEMLRDIERFKLNPSIHFEYKYFVDDAPTKYMDTIQKVRESDEEEEEEGRPAYLPVLTGIAAGVLIVTLVGIILFLAMRGYLPGFGNKSSTIQAPNLVGMSYQTLINSSDYTSKYTIVESSTKNSDTVPEGCIISQSPKYGTTMKTGGRIEVVVSLGAQTAAVPNIYNETQSDAESSLQNSGFNNYTFVSQYSDTITKGYVVSTNPKRYESVSTSSEITVYISQGPKTTMVTVPDVAGMSESDATAALEKKGFVVNVTKAYSSTVTEGDVVSQSIKAKTKVSEGKTITLTVSQGAQTSDYGIGLSLPRATSDEQYTISIAVDGVDKTVTDILPTTSRGGSVSITIPAGTLSGVHRLTIYVTGGGVTYPDDIYKELQVNFDTGVTNKTYTDNSRKYTVNTSSDGSADSVVSGQ